MGEIARAAGDAGVPIRIGVNAGSLDKRLLEKYGKATRKRWWKVPLWEASLFEEHDFRDIKISVKHHDPVVMVQAYRQLSAACDYPCTSVSPKRARPSRGPSNPRSPSGAAGRGDRRHDSSLPVGAAGRRGEGRTADPRIAQPARARAGDRLLSELWPGASGCVYTLAEQVTAGLQGLEVPLRVAVMGCVVNGPGRLARLISAWPAATARPDLRQGRGHQDRA